MRNHFRSFDRNSSALGWLEQNWNAPEVARIVLILILGLVRFHCCRSVVLCFWGCSAFELCLACHQKRWTAVGFAEFDFVIHFFILRIFCSTFQIIAAAKIASSGRSFGSRMLLHEEGRRLGFAHLNSMESPFEIGLKSYYECSGPAMYLHFISIAIKDFLEILFTVPAETMHRCATKSDGWSCRLQIRMGVDIPNHFPWSGPGWTFRFSNCGYS